MAGVDGILLGQDLKLTFTDINGNYNFAIIENFQSSETPNIISETAIDSQFRVFYFPKGWSGSFVVEQNNDVVNQYFANREAQFYLGADQANMTITVTLTYKGGTQAQYQFVGCVLTLSNAGEFTGSSIVKQTISFTANRYQRII